MPSGSIKRRREPVPELRCQDVASGEVKELRRKVVTLQGEVDDLRNDRASMMKIIERIEACRLELELEVERLKGRRR